MILDSAKLCPAARRIIESSRHLVLDSKAPVSSKMLASKDFYMLRAAQSFFDVSWHVTNDLVLVPIQSQQCCDIIQVVISKRTFEVVQAVHFGGGIAGDDGEAFGAHVAGELCRPCRFCFV